LSEGKQIKEEKTTINWENSLENNMPQKHFLASISI
jgi:hypothetical protein